jgi:hypothetical protein
MGHGGHRWIHPRWRIATRGGRPGVWLGAWRGRGGHICQSRARLGQGANRCHTSRRTEHLASGKRRVSHCVAPLIVAHLGLDVGVAPDLQAFDWNPDIRLLPASDYSL